MVREDTNDADVIRSIYEGEYSLPHAREYEFGAVSVDLGAHIGAYTVWACTRYSGLKMLAIEPLPENLELVRENCGLNQLLDRVRIECAAAGSMKEDCVRIAYNCEEDASGKRHRFIGNGNNLKQGSKSVTVDRLTLASILKTIEAEFSTGKIWTLKADCEGGEYPLLEEATNIELSMIKWIVGEHHFGIERIRDRMLSAGFSEHPKPEGLFCFENKLPFGVL